MIDDSEILDAAEFFANHFSPTKDNAEFLWSFLRGECCHAIREDGRCILCWDEDDLEA